MKRPKTKGVLGRLLKMLFKEYPVQLTVVTVCIIIMSFASTITGLFLEEFIRLIMVALDGGGWDAIKEDVITRIVIMIVIYALGILAAFVYTRIMAIVTQDFLHQTRKKMFSKMQQLPLRYFDTHPHGDIMSYYTNDIDTLRELISRTIPQLISSGLIIILLVF